MTLNKTIKAKVTRIHQEIFGTQPVSFYHLPGDQGINVMIQGSWFYVNPTDTDHSLRLAFEAMKQEDEHIREIVREEIKLAMGVLKIDAKNKQAILTDGNGNETIYTLKDKL